MKMTRAQILELAARTRGFTDEAEFKVVPFGGAIELTAYSARIEIQSDGMAQAFYKDTGRAMGLEYRASEMAVASA